MNKSIRLGHFYMDAKKFVIEEGYSWEIDWQSDVNLDAVTESTFLREYAWVVLNSGFRESIIRKIFPSFTDAFLGFASAKGIWENRELCRQKAMEVFGSRRKVEAVIDACRMVMTIGFSMVIDSIKRNTHLAVATFPFMGPTTSLHLVKNLGVDVAKPDRHLVRLAEAAGFESVRHLCLAVHQVVGDSLKEIDVVLWRYCTLCPDAAQFFRGIRNG